ncbi:hypothetical protein DFQ27_008353 [Actinomortierella ambigua]|uniref:Sulfhydryl oxidase n=1 Tax=Actinomortierella ambigua TaxID=1343610 RepID=A0A9P6UC70_9FUNG|nr:hypothetical protein DFQ27_008353 [Actinomortierella ambigua]
MAATEGPTVAQSSPSSTPLPPGMVLGPDGKPCRTCTDWKSWSKLAKTKKAQTQQGGSGSESAGASSSSSAGSAAAAAVVTAGAGTDDTAVNATAPDDCPPDREVLGRATWTFLHTMAAYYPEKPNEREQTMMKSLLSSFSQFYPCGHCAEHLRDEMKKEPPKVASRMELAWWMCGMHNKVNTMLGKDEFDCNKLDERWRDGPSDGRCD